MLQARWLRYALGVVFGVGLCWLALRGLDLGQVASELGSARPAYLVLAFALAWLGYQLRALRWRWLLQGRRAGEPPRQLFGILMVGYFLNNVLPARAGELARIALVRRHHGVAPAGTLATIMTERAMDGLLLGVAGWWALERMLGLDLPWLRAAALAFGLLLLGLFAVARQERRLSAWLGRREGALTGRLVAFLLRHAAALLEHLGELGHFAGLGRALAGTALIWLVEAGLYAAVAASFAVQLSGAQLAGFVSVVNFASLAPTPGGLGAVELVGATVLAQSGVPRETAFVLVGVQHALQYLFCLLFGLWHMARLGLWGHSIQGLRIGLKASTRP